MSIMLRHWLIFKSIFYHETFKILLYFPFVMTIYLVVLFNSSQSRVIAQRHRALLFDYAGAGDLLQVTKEAQKCCKKLCKEAQYVRTEEEKSSSGTIKKMAFFNCKD